MMKEIDIDLKYNRELHEYAKKHTAGYMTASKSPLRLPEYYPVYASHGDGCYLYDTEQNKYIDWISGLGTNILGYSDFDVVKTAIDTVYRGNLFSLETQDIFSLADLLYKTIPSAEKSKFFKTGSDATAAAVKVARAYTGKDEVIMFEGNYHGNSDVFNIHSDINNGIPEITKSTSLLLPTDLDVVQNELENNKHVACIITEPVTYEHRKEFIDGLRKLCTEYGVVIVFDEIVTHLRFDIGGIQKVYNAIPDLTCVSKGMSAGYPISALCGKSEIMDLFDVDNSSKPCFFSGTYHGDALGAAVATAVIQKCIQYDVPEHIQSVGQFLKGHFNGMAEHHEVPIRMKGLPPRMVLEYQNNEIKSLFLQETARHGILFGNIIYPTLSHTRDIIDTTVTECFTILKEMSLYIKNNDVKSHIIGKQCQDLNLRRV